MARSIARGVILVIAASLLIAPRARADDADAKRACAADYEEAQLRRQRGALLASRDVLRSCARAVCPPVIQRDCAAWLDQIERAIPSLLVQATAGGRDAIDVSVTIDGTLARPRLDGKPIEVDPGEHEIVFSFAGYPDVREKVLVVEGEQRRIAAHFEHPAAPIDAASPPRAPAHTIRPTPPVVYVLGGVSLVGLASFATFGALATSERGHLHDTCSPFCTDDEMRTLRTRIVVADVSLAVSIVSLGAAAVLYLTRPAREAAAPPVAVVATPLRSGGSVTLAGWF